MVDFPIDGLDLSKYILGPQVRNSRTVQHSTAETVMRNNHDKHRSFLFFFFLFSPLLTLLYSPTFSSPVFTLLSSPHLFSSLSPSLLSPLSSPGPQRSSSVRSLRGISALRRNGWWTLYGCVQKRYRQEMVTRLSVLILLFLLTPLLSLSFLHLLFFNLCSPILVLLLLPFTLFHTLLFLSNHSLVLPLHFLFRLSSSHFLFTSFSRPCIHLLLL